MLFKLIDIWLIQSVAARLVEYLRINLNIFYSTRFFHVCVHLISSAICRIGEDVARQNVFTVEREVKNALFKLRSRSPSVGGGQGSTADVGGALNVQVPTLPVLSVNSN